MPENPSLDHELRSGLMKELQAKLQSASCHQNFLELGDFTVHTDIPGSHLSLRVKKPRFTSGDPNDKVVHQVMLVYRVVPDIVVQVVISKWIGNASHSAYLTENGSIALGPYEWPGAAVKVDRLWQVLIVCGLGYIHNRRGLSEPNCNKCPNQFVCLARI